jgi:hypothetical protein
MLAQQLDPKLEEQGGEKRSRDRGEPLTIAKLEKDELFCRCQVVNSICHGPPSVHSAFGPNWVPPSSHAVAATEGTQLGSRVFFSTEC